MGEPMTTERREPLLFMGNDVASGGIAAAMAP